MFTKGDIVTFGLVLLATALCTISAVVAPDTTAKIVSASTGAVFLGLGGVLLAWKVSAARCDFVTKWGLRVRVGVKNSPSKLQVESWCEWVRDALRVEYPLGNISTCFNGKMAAFVDVEKMSVMGRWVRGYAQETVAVVGLCGGPDTKDPAGRACVRGLFGHEIGHIVLGRLGVEWSEAVQHPILARLLGA